MQEFFARNDVIVHSVYGQAFTILGVAMAVQSLRHSRLRLARYLWLLASFGILHGLTEWGFVFIPIQATYMSPAVMEFFEVGQTALMISSFIFLFLFGLYLTGHDSADSTHRLRSVLMGVGVAWVGGVVFLSAGAADRNIALRGAEIVSRYLFSLPGSVMGAYGLLRQAREVSAMGLPRSAGALRLAAFGLGAYAVLSGLVTPSHTFLLSRWVNYETIGALVPIPVPIFRAAAILLLTVGMIRSLEVFQVETDRLIEEARAQKLLVAERELAALSGIAVRLGEAGGPDEVAANALDSVLDLLKLQRGSVEILVPPGDPSDHTPVLITVAERGGASPDSTQRLEERAVRSGEPQRLLAPDDGEQVAIPLRAGGRVVGVMLLVSSERLHLTAETLRLLVSIGHQIGVAAENARLWEQVRQKEAVRSMLLQRIITAQEEERRRIARDLHDDTGQRLSALIMSLRSALEVAPTRTRRMRELLEKAQEQALLGLQDLRALIVGLRPTTLDDLGLAAAVRRTLQDLGDRHDLKTHLKVAGLPARLSGTVETALFRTLQEALTNVGKHACARNVYVSLALDGEFVVGEVQDDGCGFEIKAALAEDGNALGILGMQERASLLGGTLRVHSSPGRGTRVDVRLPLTVAEGGETVVAAHSRTDR